jgi:hypothetical protein
MAAASDTPPAAAAAAVVVREVRAYIYSTKYVITYSSFPPPFPFLPPTMARHASCSLLAQREWCRLP